MPANSLVVVPTSAQSPSRDSSKQNATVMVCFTINVEPRRVPGPARSVLGCARVLSTILHRHVADVHVTDDVAMHCYVLPNHKPAIS